MSLFDILTLRSFSTGWFWIVLAIEWAMLTYWVFGIPGDILWGARGSDALEKELKELTRLNVQRRLRLSRQFGWPEAAFAGFLTIFLVILAFWYWSEVAQALLILITPLVWVYYWNIKLAQKVETHGLHECVKWLNRLHTKTQILGAAVIFLSASWAFVFYLA